MPKIKPQNLMNAALLSCAMALPAMAWAEDDEPVTADLFACATQTLVECPSSGDCQTVAHADSNAPAIIYVYMADGYIAGREPGGSVRVSKIIEARPVGDELILQGNDLEEGGRLGAAGWTMTIDRESGRMSMSVSADQVVFAIFGVCEAPPT
jgi:hypothetical protein